MYFRLLLQIYPSDLRPFFFGPGSHISMLSRELIGYRYKKEPMPCGNDVIWSYWDRPIGLRHLEFHARTLYFCHDNSRRDWRGNVHDNVNVFGVGGIDLICCCGRANTKTCYHQYIQTCCCKYSGAKKYLVSHQLCKFSHLKRWERPVIFIIGIPQLWETK